MPVNEATVANAENAFTNMLAGKDSIYIKQKRTSGEVVELVTGCEISNRFHIQENQDGNLLFKMREDSDCLMRQCCKGINPFELNVLAPTTPDEVAPPFRKEDLIMYFQRDFACTNATCCCPCCFMCSCTQCCGAQVLQVKSNDGKLIGTVTEENWTWCMDGIWLIRDNAGTPQFEVHVSCSQLCAQCCCQDVELTITRAGTSDVVGKMTRKWICKCGNIILDKDEFLVEFYDKTIIGAEKVLVVGAVMLMKYIYFENNDQ